MQAHRRAARLSAIAGRRSVRWLLGALVALVVVLGAGYLWLRDSSLVAVHSVKVVGVSGADARRIREALTTAARNMTTLDVNMGQLRTAVEPYPDVKHIAVSTRFPHGMVIRVIEQVPVAVVLEAGRRVEVAGDGTLLNDAPPVTSLPTISLSVPPGGRQLTGDPLREVQLLAAGPYQLLSRIGGVSDGPGHGLAVRLRNGPSIYFGDSSQLAAKWTAAAAVLAHLGAATPVYIDVTDPNRPAAGAGSDTSASPSSATATTAATGSSGASSGTATTAATGSSGASSASGTASTGG